MTNEKAEASSSVLGDLRRWAKTGIAPTNLQECEALVYVLNEELSPPQTLSPGRQIALLYEAVHSVVTRAREQAIAQATTEMSQHRNPIFQVAAAGELLGLHDTATFVQLRRLVGLSDEEWRHLAKRGDNQGPQNRRHLYAAVWIGRRSARTGERLQATLLEALEADIRLYLSSAQARQQLAELLVETPVEEPGNITQSRDSRTHAVTTPIEDPGHEGTRSTTWSDPTVSHYEHYVITDLYRAIKAANDERDGQAILFHLDLLRLRAESSPSLRAPIATMTSDLLHRRGSSPGPGDSTVQQQCVNILAACFADGPPFKWNVRERVSYPTSPSWIHGANWWPLPLKLKLDRLRFADIDFSGIHFTGVDFRETTFVRCQFVGCYFEVCDFADVRMESCQLTDINAIEEILMEEMEATEGVRRDSTRDTASRRTIHYLWEGIIVPSKPWHSMSCIFKFCLFERVVMELTAISGACFWSCGLSQARIGPKEAKRRHQVRCVEFTSCDLTAAALEDLDLGECLFIRGDLRYANFKRSSLFRATIETSLLRSAFFEGADLREVFGLEKFLTKFRREAIYDKTTLLPPSLMGGNEPMGNK